MSYAENIAEICWMVDRRNTWARRRGTARSRMNYARDAGKSPREVRGLVKAFEKINAEKSKLQKYTLRLRRLLKKENCVLVSDSSAGYSMIIHRKSGGFIHRTQIRAMAADFEVNLHIHNMLIKK